MADLYRKKPVEVEVYHLEDSKESILGAFVFMFGELETEEFNDMIVNIVHNNGGIFIETLEGNMLANIGDYIIKGIKGEFYPCKSDVFELTYEKVED